MGTAGVSLSQMSNPKPLSMARYFFVFDQSFSRWSGSDCMISREAWAHAAWLGLIAALKIVCLEWVRRNSMTSGGCDEAPRARERLRKAAADHVDIVVKAEVIDGPATLAAEDPEAVRVVEHREAAVLLSDLGQLGKAGDVALHGVHPLDHEHLRGLRIGRRDHLPEVVGVVVREPL